MNDREHNSRSLVVRHSGWLCAGLAAATGLYSFCGPTSAVRAAGVPAETANEDYWDDGEAPARVSLNESSAAEADDRVNRALFESDANAVETPKVRRMSFWPLKKKPAPAPTSQSSGLLNLGRPSSGAVKDPFAEADAAAQAKILSKSTAVNAAAIEGTGFSKSSTPISNRRRLQAYQAEATVAKNPEPTAKPKSNKLPELTPDILPKTPAGAAKTTVAKTPKTPVSETMGQPTSEMEMRALFEGDVTQTAEVSAVKENKEDIAPVAEIAETDALPDPFKAASEDEIRQVSDADGQQLTSQEQSAEQISESTPLPTEALKYRAEAGLQRSRSEATRRQTTQQQTTQTTAGASSERTANESISDRVPASNASRAQADRNVVERVNVAPHKSSSQVARELLKTATALPAPLPEFEPDPFEPDPFDNRPTEPAPAQPKPQVARKKIAVAQPEPAMIRASESAPELLAPQKRVTAEETAAESPIRAAAQPKLPALQVVANRPMELPSPEGWSAAVKLNARRAARYAALTGQSPKTEPKNEDVAKAVPVEAAQAMPRRRAVDESIAYQGQSASRRSQATQQPVVIEQIEDEGTVRVLSAAEPQAFDIRDAQHIEEAAGPTIEPAKIQESAAEPVVVPEYAAQTHSVWLLYLMTASGVLFGFYGMWTGWFRSADSN